MVIDYPKRLIEVDLPIKRISAHARREKSIRHGHISTLHIWWARRPLGQGWAGEKPVLHKLRFHPDFVAPFPPLAKGGSGGVVPAGLATRSSHALSLSVLSHPSREPRRIVFAFQGSRITPPAPPSQGGERDRSLAASFHRAQQKHASRNRPSNSVNTNFSPAQARGRTLRFRLRFTRSVRM